MCNNCLATLAQAISLGVRNLVFSSIVWTCDVTVLGKCFLGVKGGFGDFFEVDCLPEGIDYHLLKAKIVMWLLNCI